jgi:hypothetical protein
MFPWQLPPTPPHTHTHLEGLLLLGLGDGRLADVRRGSDNVEASPGPGPGAGPGSSHGHTPTQAPTPVTPLTISHTSVSLLGFTPQPSPGLTVRVSGRVLVPPSS